MGTGCTKPSANKDTAARKKRDHFSSTVHGGEDEESEEFEEGEELEEDEEEGTDEEEDNTDEDEPSEDRAAHRLLVEEPDGHHHHHHHQHQQRQQHHHGDGKHRHANSDTSKRTTTTHNGSSNKRAHVDDDGTTMNKGAGENSMSGGSMQQSHHDHNHNHNHNHHNSNNNQNGNGSSDNNDRSISPTENGCIGLIDNRGNECETPLSDIQNDDDDDENNERQQQVEDDLSSISSFSEDDQEVSLYAASANTLTRMEKHRQKTEQEEEEVAPEYYTFSDFDVHVETVKFQRNKLQTKDREFVFGDFQVQVEQDLEDEIIKQHLLKKRRSDAQHFTRLDAFLWGDLQLDHREIEQQQSIAMEYRKKRKEITSFKVRTLIGHPHRVKSIAIAGGEQTYAACSNNDANISIYDVHTGRDLILFSGHAGNITCVTFSPNSKFIATSSIDATVAVWDTVTGKRLYCIDHVRVVLSTAFTSNNRYLITSCQDRHCRVWDYKRQKIVRVYGDHKAVVVCIACHPKQDLVATGCTNRTVRLWASLTGVTQHVLLGHEGIIFSCAFSHDGKRVVSNDETQLRMWSVSNGVCVLSLAASSLPSLVRPSRSFRIHGHHNKQAWIACGFCPLGVDSSGEPAIGGEDYNIIASSTDRNVQVLQGTTGKQVLSFQTRAPVYCLSAGRSSTVMCGDGFGNIYVLAVS